MPLGLGHLLHERRERGLVRDVGDDGDHPAFGVRERPAVRADGGVQGVLAPPGDVCRKDGVDETADTAMN